MNIYDPYPEEIEVNGQTVRVNLRYDHVLRALDAQDMPELLPEDKIELQCELLLGYGERMPRTLQERCDFLTAVFSIFPKPEADEKPAEKYIDFHQDAALIRSAFFRIGVDLTKDKIHFLQFLELLRDLPSDTALMRTIELRMRPIPERNGHNDKQIAEIIKAKQKVAIKISEEERRTRFASALKNSNLLKGR